MTVVDTRKDTDTLTLEIVNEFTAPREKVWELWADPRKLERWWGPPTWPATFTDHDFVPGGEARYFMTGPEGEKAHGWWRFVSITPVDGLEFDDGFADDTGSPQPDSPVIHGRVTLAGTADGTRMTVTTRFDSLQQMEEVVAMGMVEGMTGALGQADAILAEG